jgi:tRNA (adenine37-N6)-methyltransferase
MSPIGTIRTSHSDAAVVAPQASHAPGERAVVAVREDLADALLGLDMYRYVWLITWLHEREPGDPVPLQLVPRAAEAEGRLQGVFASRAPARPNPIGLSLVRNLGVDGTTITIGGVDFVDGTPVLDIKPWFRDCDDPAAFEPPASPT